MRWAAAVKLPVSATQTKARMLKRVSMKGSAGEGEEFCHRSLAVIIAISVHNPSSNPALIRRTQPL
ncbi:hypothetical protein KAM429_00180 [Aquipseudomonas alcaligenes]|uniref:Uncharacterized protein n=1 Tax=Aquipseudomonas alcaligenes TaxID=43263 RepID=A0AA37CC63_AQUAC|nr:hypothetical protein KAM426_14940 [Pseudomonas alcaligenes]GIZ65418.1 hypothetical protein KAM428_05030 [Pseudomonas alcaligenes]GIZ69257.1 hypothetical protein KAM429_00180 [Pseudomonas alcaligenes]GIZ73609.1 hypothetical protein KAM430_00180 [Pseudomonas alcaligenes]GIZ77970.1 hypothetical protein KAM432_00180 [Pseudomonas alcaligenes]